MHESLLIYGRFCQKEGTLYIKYIHILFSIFVCEMKANFSSSTSKPNRGNSENVRHLLVLWFIVRFSGWGFPHNNWSNSSSWIIKLEKKGIWQIRISKNWILIQNKWVIRIWNDGNLHTKETSQQRKSQNAYTWANISLFNCIYNIDEIFYYVWNAMDGECSGEKYYNNVSKRLNLSHILYEIYSSMLCSCSYEYTILYYSLSPPHWNINCRKRVLKVSKDDMMVMMMMHDWRAYIQHSQNECSPALRSDRKEIAYTAKSK